LRIRACGSNADKHPARPLAKQEAGGKLGLAQRQGELLQTSRFVVTQSFFPAHARVQVGYLIVTSTTLLDRRQIGCNGFKRELAN
jgi:hypothetical protein